MVPLLYKKNPKQVQCLNKDRKLVKCADVDLCVSISWIYEKHFEYQCQVPPENGIKLYIDNHFIPDVAKKLLYKQRIQYICNYNQCNNQTIGNKVIQKVEQIYDISAIKRQLHIVDEQTTEQQASTTILFTTNAMIDTTTSTDIPMSSPSVFVVNDPSSSSAQFETLSSRVSNSTHFTSEGKTFTINDLTSMDTRPMKSRSAQQLMTIPIYFIVHLIEISFYHI
ncbi:unnamed protein product [Adineta ricciae]|uniref:Uncharacterized protein n=1 Tax=Adineta ricciae TaxID=249248 RepID=A0A815IGX5_ADIRI|nr:unnamed protein product [Adineta ricciae]CAF1514360.1 unnamed protein product [Adineta ricciae]